MNELVQLLQQKTGLSQDMAQQVANTVVGFLKTKLPGPLASGLDDLLGAGASGDAAAASGDAAGGASGLLGKAESLVGDFFKKKDA
jgi:hypothetical protein